MTTGPWGQAAAASNAPHGLPGASDRPGDPSTQRSQGQGRLLADAATAQDRAASAERRDVKTEPTSPYGGQDKDKEAPEKAASLPPGDPQDARATPQAKTATPGPADPSPAQGAARTPPSSGEGAPEPLPAALAWSEAAVGVGLALGLLVSGLACPADLRSVSGLLGGGAVYAGLRAGTGSALRSVALALGAAEHSARERVHAAVRFLTGRRGAPGPH